jgi:hypothetical protein
MKILLVAFACHPQQGSEAAVGWRVARILAQKYPIVVLTHVQQKESICQAQEKGEIPSSAKFIFLGSLIKWHPNRMIARWQSWLEYARWLREASRNAASICDEYSIDLVHHVTITTWRMPPVRVPDGIPLVWGPLGGAAHFPWRLLSAMSCGAALFEILRNVTNQLLVRNPFLIKGSQRAFCVLGANQESVEWMRKLVAPETPVLKLSATFFSDSKVEEFKALFASRQMDSPLRAFAGGNLIGSKGVDLALRAIRLAKDRGVIIPYTVASFGPEKEYLEKLAARLEIMSQITFHAGFQGQEYQKALMEHSVFLLPSFREGSPGTILEAMLAGQIPVVVKASAQGEIVDSACGFPVRVGSKNQICEELAKALIRLHEIPDLRKALSDASHKKIQNEYCTSHFENKLEAAYRAALGKKPLPPCPKV